MFECRQPHRNNGKRMRDFEITSGVRLRLVPPIQGPRNVLSKTKMRKDAKTLWTKVSFAYLVLGGGVLSVVAVSS